MKELDLRSSNQGNTPMHTGDRSEARTGIAPLTRTVHLYHCDFCSQNLILKKPSDHAWLPLLEVTSHASALSARGCPVSVVWVSSCCPPVFTEGKLPNKHRKGQLDNDNSMLWFHAKKVNLRCKGWKYTIPYVTKKVTKILSCFLLLSHLSTYAYFWRISWPVYSLWHQPYFNFLWTQKRIAKRFLKIYCFTKTRTYSHTQD